MPTHGKATSIVHGAFITSQWFMSISSTETQETAETTPFQVNDKTFIIGPSDAKIEASGRYEGLLNQVRDIIFKQIGSQASQVITIGWGMGGPKAGDVCEFAKELVTGYQVTAPMEGIVTVTMSCQVDGGLGHGVHLLTPTAQAATYNGTTQTLAGAIPTGFAWGAAFHRLAATGTAASVVKIQTSADGTTWVDLPGATASFAATMTGSILVTGIAATAGLYVRAVETITGTGSSTVLAAFGLY